MIVKAALEKQENIIDEANKSIQAVLHDLGEKLKTYGGEGEVEVTLTVRTKDSAWGRPEAEFSKTTKLPYCHPNRR